MEATTCLRGPARSLPSRLQGCRGSGVDFRRPSVKEKGDAYCGQHSERQIVSREAVRQALWDKLAENGDGSG